LRIRIRRKYWTLRYVANFGADGECDEPQARSKLIRVRAGLPPKRELEVLVHEMLHAGLWDVSEDTIDRIAADVTERLAAIGWKKVKPPTQGRWRPKRADQIAIGDDLRYILRSRMWAIDGGVLDELASDIGVVLARLGWTIDDLENRPLPGAPLV